MFRELVQRANLTGPGPYTNLTLKEFTMRREDIYSCGFAVLLAGFLILGGCDTGNNVDAVTTASVPTNAYTNMSREELLASIATYTGVCMVSTVNAGGTPNIAVFQPTAIPPDHVAFGWAPNATKENFLREKKAVMIYDLYDKSVTGQDEASKKARHRGAKVQLTLEEDQAVLNALKADVKQRLITSGYSEENAAARAEALTFCKIREFIALGSVRSLP
jgi:flavin reductase (DIM6/NTAB) family NADH-FMN oxidoreductase RutF